MRFFTRGYLTLSLALISFKEVLAANEDSKNEGFEKVDAAFDGVTKNKEVNLSHRSLRGPPEFVAVMLEELHLRKAEVANLRPRPGQPLQLGIQGKTYDLQLTKTSVRAPGYKLLIQNASGEIQEVEPGEETTYKGELAGVPGSSVAASVTEDNIYATVTMPDGEEFVVEPISHRVQGAIPGDHAIYNRNDIVVDMGKTDIVVPAPGNVFVPPHRKAAESPSTVDSTEPTKPGNAVDSTKSTKPRKLQALQRTELAIDADYEYYLDYGSVASVENRINAVINTMNEQYETDVAITHEITTILVQTSATNPYTSSDALTLLEEFRDHWSANHANIQRDVAQLFTGKEIVGGTIGIAWVGVICNAFYGYGMVQSDFNRNFACATDLSAHELGHNWSAGHCSCTSNTMNPYITCANAFRALDTIPAIEAHRDSRSCLDTIGVGCSDASDCNDGDSCTTDICNAGTCSNTPINCDDGNLCTIDTCNAGTCSFTPINCDDGNPCTTDTCNAGTCSNTPVEGICCGNGVCEDGEECGNCSADCISGTTGAVCGNGVCEAGDGENCVNCSQDCNGRQNGKPSNRFCCSTDGGENPVGCGDSRCTTNGWACNSTQVPPIEYCCGDTRCEGAEDKDNCAIDCDVPTISPAPTPSPTTAPTPPPVPAPPCVPDGDGQPCTAQTNCCSGACTGGKPANRVCAPS